MIDRPDPLTPSECDLRDFPRMPLDIMRLKRSKAWLAAKRRPELGFYFINLWTAAWHDVPCGSLEDDDDVLADVAMCDARTWGKIRETVLRGWVLCSDGRLHHPLIAELAVVAWKAKLAQRERSRKGNETRWGRNAGGNAGTSSRDPNGMTTPSPRDPPGIPQGCPKDSPKDPKGEGREREREEEKKEPFASLTHARNDAAFGFATFWLEYPRKRGKDAAVKAYAAAIKRGATPDQISAGLANHRWPDDPQFIKHPATWLNAGCWNDEPDPEAKPKQPASKLDWLYAEQRAERPAYDLEIEPEPHGRLQ